MINGGRGVNGTLERWLGIAGKIFVVSLSFSHSSTSKPSIRDDHITDARNVVDSIQDV